MAEALTAQLGLELGGFTAALANATAQFQQFAAQITSQIQQISQAFQALPRALQQVMQAEQQLAQAMQQKTQATQQQGQAVQQVTQQVTNLNQQVNNYSASVRISTGNVTQFIQQHNTLNQTLNQTTVIANQAATGLGNFLQFLRATAIIEFVREAVMLAARMQDLHIAFRVIEGSADAANTTLATLFATSQRLGLDFQKVAADFKNFEAATKGTALEGENSRKVFEALASGARAMGVAGEPLHRLLQALEIMMSRGTVSAIQLHRQLAVNLPGGIKLMADGLGITTQLLEQMTKAGILPADVAIVGLAKSLSGLGTSGAAQDIDRLSTTFAGLKNETTAWMTGIGEGIGSTLKPWLDYLVKISAKVRELFDIHPPGYQPTAGAGSQGLFPLAPGTLGYMPANPYMPSEFETGSPYAPANEAVKTQWPITTSAYTALIVQEAQRRKEDPGLLSRLINQESRFDPTAVSSAGAMGLGQIMPGTGPELGLTSRADFMDPSKNIAASALYVQRLRQQLQTDFGKLDDETRLVLAAYNAGIGNVEKAIRHVTSAGGTPTFASVLPLLPKPSETGPYVRNIYGAGTQGAGASTTDQLNPMDFLVKNVEKTLQVVPQLQEQFQRLQQSGMNYGGILGKEFTKEANEAVKSFTQVAELLARFPALAAQLTPEQMTQVELAAKQVAILEKEIADEQGVAAEAHKTVAAKRELEKLALERRNLEIQFEDEIARVAALGTKNRVDNLEAALAKERDLLEKRYASEDVLRRFDEAAASAMRQRIADVTEKAIEKQEAIEDRIAQTRALSTKSHVDDLAARLTKEHAMLEKDGADEVQLAAHTAASVAAIQKAQADEYEKLVKGIATPIASVFEKLLSGTHDILDTLKQMFFKFLADLAAQALATQLIIPILTQLVGGGSGGSALGFAGTLAGTGGSTAGGIAGAGGAAGGIFGYLQTAYSLASSGSSLAGGPSASSLFGIGKITLGQLGIGSATTGLTTASLGTAAEAGEGASLGFGAGGGAGASTTIGALSLSSLATAAGVGIAAGEIFSKINALLGLHGVANTTVSGAGAGAIAGTIIYPGIGTAIGAIVGAIGGYIAGILGQSKTPTYAIHGVHQGGVMFDPGTASTPGFGLTQYQPFVITDVTRKAVGAHSQSIDTALDDAINKMYESVISSFKSFSPSIQKALVDPLNQAADNLASDIAATTFKGDDIAKQVQTFVGTTLPKLFQDTFGPVQKAAQTLEPYVQKFDQVMKQAAQTLDQLARSQAQAHLSLAQTVISIQEATFSPAQQFVARRKDLDTALALLQNATPAQQVTLIPQVQDLAKQIMSLGMNQAVLGQDPQAVRNLQQELTDKLSSVNVTIDSAYGQLRDGVSQQITLAQQQVDLLTSNLTNTTTMNNNIQQAVQVLQGINEALAPFSSTGQADTSLEVQGSLLNVQVQALDVLQSINTSLAGIQGHQAGIPFVPYNQLAFLHAGERVVPAHQNNGGEIHIHVNASGQSTDALVQTIISKIEQKSGRLGNTKIAVH